MKNQLNNQAELLFNPRAYVQDYFQLKELTVLPNGSVVGYKTEKELFRRLFLDYNEMFKAYATIPSKEKPKALTDKLLQHALSEFIDLEVKAARKRALESISFNGIHDTTLITKWVKAVKGAETALDIAVMGHFIVQVKRKALGLKVFNHILPVIYSRVHGGGKSEAVKKLISPLKILTLNMTLAEIVDDRLGSVLQDNYICFLDEVAKSERASLSNLKRILTSEDVDTRILHTSNSTSVKVNVTMIGTSNKPINELIFDEGMRRYYQVDALPLLDWTAVNEIDYLKLWQSVDPEHDFLTPVWQDLKAAQAGLSTVDQEDEYLLEAGIMNDGPRVEIPLQKLYDDYKLFCTDSGYKHWSKQHFAKKLRSRDLRSVEKKIDGKTTTCYMIPAGSIIDGRVYLGVAK